jgi:hypothetical protein
MQLVKMVALPNGLARRPFFGPRSGCGNGDFAAEPCHDVVTRTARLVELVQDELGPFCRLDEISDTS